jgi:hypothetical protein
MSEPDAEGIYQDSDSGYDRVTMTGAPHTSGAEWSRDDNDQHGLIHHVTEATGAAFKAVKRFLGGDSEPPEWLLRTWTFAGKKPQYEAYASDWFEEYPDLTERVKDATEQGLIDGVSKPLPTPEYPHPTPDVHWINVKPRTLEKLKAQTREKPGPKTNATQLTIQGREIDPRNRANLDLIVADIENVENLAHSYLHQFRSEPTKRQRRRLTCELQRVMTLRGQDLSRSLYGSICLRLGMPLPADFWHLPPEILGKE